MAMVTVDVQVACDEQGIPSPADMHSWIEAAIMQSGRSPQADAEIAVRVVDAAEMQTLNQLYRRQDKPTNVLSFPADDISGLPDGSSRLLGDVVVCATVVAAEAAEQGKAPADHWGHMLVHGTLHLLGFDHETGADAAEMERLETNILASRNVTHPYSDS